MKRLLCAVLALSIIALASVGCTAPEPEGTAAPSTAPAQTATPAAPTPMPTADMPAPSEEPDEPVLVEEQEGRYIGEGATVDVGGLSVTSEWLPMQYAIWGKERQTVRAAVTEKSVFVLVGGQISEFINKNGVLALARDFPDIVPETESATYSSIQVGGNESLVLTCGAHHNACILRDGKKAATNTERLRINNLVMHPSGTWGVTSWTDVEDLAKVTTANDTFAVEPYEGLFAEMASASCVGISEKHIMLSGKSVETENQVVFIYDLDGNLALTLGDVNSGDGKLRVTRSVIETSNGYVVGGDFGDVTFFDLQGNYLGSYDRDEMFGAGTNGKGSKWLSSLVPMPNGDILATMSVTLTADETQGDVTLFLISGF